MRRLSYHLKILIPALLLLLAVPGGAQSERLIRFGLFPYVDPNTLIQHHRPLKLYLEQALARPIVMLTASDFETFMQRTLAGDYDLILSAPHMARHAELAGGYRRIAMAVHRVQGVILTRRDTGIEQIVDLRGKIIAFAEKQAIINLMALAILENYDLHVGQQLQTLDAKTHNNALLAMLHGDADAAIVPILLWRRLDEAAKQQLELLEKTPAVPGVMFMTNPRLQTAEMEMIRDAILRFAQSSLSKTYFFPSGFIPITEDAMRSLDPYIKSW